jgi:hypothetical protein
MAKEEGNAAPMCEDCMKLLGASRSTEPHSKLSYLSDRRVSSMLGPGDETYYRCRICDHEWLHETGSQGMGWVTMLRS